MLKISEAVYIDQWSIYISMFSFTQCKTDRWIQMTIMSMSKVVITGGVGI